MTADFNFYLNRQGAQGKQGEKGEQGFSPVISIENSDATTYQLRITNETESFVTPNLKSSPLNIIPGAGKFVLYDETTNVMYNSAKPSELVDFTNLATTVRAGVVRLANSEDLEEGTDAVVTASELKNAIESVEADIPTDVVSSSELADAIAGVEAEIPGIATVSTVGVIKPDGTTVTITSDGTISAVAQAPTNMMTTNTAQTVTGSKTFNGSYIHMAPTTIGSSDKTVLVSQNGINFGSGLANTSWNITTDSGDLKFAVSGYGTSSNGFTFTNNFTTIRLADTITIGANTVLTNASVDGTSITYNSSTGKISAVSSTPANMVTTDTTQTISGAKTFSSAVTASSGIITNGITNNGALNQYIQNNQAIALHGDFSTQADIAVPINIGPSGMSLTPAATAVEIAGHYDSTADVITTSVDIKAEELTRTRNNTSYEILDSSNVDGTTITYDSATGKISAVSSTPSVIDGGEETVQA